MKTLSLLALLLLPGGATPSTPVAPNVVEAEGVRIEVSIRNNVYTWAVTNEDAPPLTRFEVGHRMMYNARVPDGWRSAFTPDRFTAWTDGRRHAIRPGSTQRFQATVDIRGGVLGVADVTLGTAADEAAIRVPAVWSSKALPRSQVALVAGSLVLVGLVHAALVARADRKRRQAPSAG
ncbi:MAG: hypothetical protein ACYTG1_08730 [Planctomycetota bacterium]|jgi:hypothetical protein